MDTLGALSEGVELLGGPAIVGVLSCFILLRFFEPYGWRFFMLRSMTAICKL